MNSYGKFQVVEFVGEGGFGRVFKAYDPVLKRHVAIKTCSLRDEHMLERFTREAEIAASLRHPNIVTVYDFGDENGEPYLVQEYLEGEDLDRKLKRGDTIANATLIEWLRQVADGLLYAHARGVMHRDVKPGNVRILPDGGVRIMDFGIAKLMQSDRQLTQTGFSVGTTGYLAPEQLKGEELDHRVDIFAFGVMTYEVFARRKPFEGDTITNILYRIVHEEPPPLREVAPHTPARLVAVIERCLRKNREERYHSFAHVIGELEEAARSAARAEPVEHTSAPAPFVLPSVLAAPNAGGPAPARRRMSPALWGLAGTTLVAAVIGVLNVSSLGRSSTADQDSPDTTVDDLAGVGTPALPESTSVAKSADNTSSVTPGPTSVPSATAGAPAAPPRETARVAAGNGARTEGRPPAPTPQPRPAAAQLDAKRVLLLVRSELAAALDVSESTLSSELMGAGFEVIDADGAEGRALIAARQAGDIARIGQTVGAATVLVVDAAVSARPITGAMFSGSATVTVKAYDSANSRLLQTERFEIGSAQTPGEVGPTAEAAATAAARAAAYQAARAVVRRLTEPQR